MLATPLTTPLSMILPFRLSYVLLLARMWLGVLLWERALDIHITVSFTFINKKKLQTAFPCGVLLVIGWFGEKNIRLSSLTWSHSKLWKSGHLQRGWGVSLGGARVGHAPLATHFDPDSLACRSQIWFRHARDVYIFLLFFFVFLIL